MNKYDIYIGIFIFILIDCAHSQDKNFYQTEPAIDEIEQTNESSDITQHTDQSAHPSTHLGYDNYVSLPTINQSEYPIYNQHYVYEQYVYDYGATVYYPGYEQEPYQPYYPEPQYQTYGPYQPHPTPQDGKYYLIEPQTCNDVDYNLVPITHVEYMNSYIPSQEPILYYFPHSEFHNQPQQISFAETEQDIYSSQVILPTSGYQPLEPTESGPTGVDEDNDFDKIVKELEKLIDDDKTDAKSKTEDPTLESVKYGNSATDGNYSDEENFEVREIAEESDEKIIDEEESDEKYTGDPVEDKSAYRIVGPVKECIKINLFKRDYCGHLVSMVCPGEFEKNEDRIIIKWKLFNNLEALRCDDSMVWKRGPCDPIPLSLVYYKTDCCFIFGYENEFVLIKWIETKWSKKSRKLPEYIKFYTTDSEGNEVELSRNDYIVEVNIKKTIRYKLNNCKCNKIVVRNMVVWEKTDLDDYPNSVKYINKNIKIFFNNLVLSFGRKDGKYVLLKSINK